MTTHRCDCDYCGYGDALADTLQRESVLTNEWMQRALQAEREREEALERVEQGERLRWELHDRTGDLTAQKNEAERTAAALLAERDEFRRIARELAYGMVGAGMAGMYDTVRITRALDDLDAALAPTKEEA